MEIFIKAQSRYKKDHHKGEKEAFSVVKGKHLYFRIIAWETVKYVC